MRSNLCFFEGLEQVGGRKPAPKWDMPISDYEGWRVKQIKRENLLFLYNISCSTRVIHRQRTEPYGGSQGLSRSSFPVQPSLQLPTGPAGTSSSVYWFHAGSTPGGAQ